MVSEQPQTFSALPTSQWLASTVIAIMVFNSGLSLDLRNNKMGIYSQLDVLHPISFARVIPVISNSYSTWLLVTENLNLKETSTMRLDLILTDYGYH